MSRKVVFSICALLLLLSLCLVEAKKKKNPKSDVEKMKENCLQIVVISAVVVVVVEIANYMLSYGRPAFRATSTKLISTAKELADLECALPASSRSEQKAASLKKDLKRLNTEMQQAKMLSTFTTAASMIIMFNWMSSSGLEDDKPSPFDAGYALVFILCSQLLRCCLNRCMGVSLPSFAASTAGNWFDNMASENRR